MPKASKKRSHATQTPVEALQAQYISDLRVLLDQAHSREEKLMAMLEQEREPKLAIVPRTSPANVLTPDFDANSMNDVATFDEKDDAEQIRKHSDLEKTLESEFAAIASEHAEAHAE